MDSTLNIKQELDNALMMTRQEREEKIGLNCFYTLDDTRDGCFTNL